MADKAEYLIAHSSSGEVVNDPSEDMLFMMFEDVAAGDLEYFIVDRANDPGNTYAQTVPCGAECGHGPGDWWTVERREGGPDSHWGACVNSMRKAHEILAGWAMKSEPRGKEFADVEWEKLKFDSA